MDTSLLEDWYADLCNGDWEHFGGIEIQSLDNPGWMITVTYWPFEPDEAAVGRLTKLFSDPTKPIYAQYESSEKELKFICNCTHGLSEALRMIVAIKV